MASIKSYIPFLFIKTPKKSILKPLSFKPTLYLGTGTELLNIFTFAEGSISCITFFHFSPKTIINHFFLKYLLSIFLK